MKKVILSLLLPFFLLLLPYNLICQNWNEVLKAVASDRDAGDYFGVTVDISGDFAIIGARIKDSNPKLHAGAAYIFERDSSDLWKETQKLLAPVSESYDHFGSSVSISGRYAIVTASREDEDASEGNTLSEAGSAYIFRRNGSGVWDFEQKIVASDREADDYFGISASLSGNFAIVGAPHEDHDVTGGNTLFNAGSAYIFERNGVGVWNEVKKIVASTRNGNYFFGVSTSISGNIAIVGSYKDREDVTGGNPVIDAGAAYIFERNGMGIWNETQKLVASDRTNAGLFGGAVSLSGNLAIAGAVRALTDPLGGNTLLEAGSAYIFGRDEVGMWDEKQKIVASDRDEDDLFSQAISLSQNKIIVGAHIESEDSMGGNTLIEAGSAYIFEFPSSFTTVQGNVFWDKNNDCTRQLNEPFLSGWLVKSNPESFFSLTNPEGDFYLKLDTGNHQIELIPNANIGRIFNSIICPPTNYFIHIDSTSTDTSGFDFALDLTLCHQMTASIVGNRRRLCSPSGTTVQYANLGLDTAFNAQVFVEYSDQMFPYGASMPFTVPKRNRLAFDLGDVPPITSGTIHIQDSVRCNVNFIGLTPCVKAWVKPFSNCNVDTSWCGDELGISLNCSNLDVVDYVIKNIGTCDMSDSSAYRVFLDSSLVNMGKLSLISGDSLHIRVITNGKTSRVEVDQTPNHPSNQYQVGTLEACGLASGLVVSKGFIHPYPQSDPSDISIETDCGLIRGSYDPNDKLVQPTGLTSQHYTKPGTELDYTLRFQNTGNDTAFLVRLIDTLSMDLDIATLRQGISSHPYTLEVSGRGKPILTFTFDPIALVDSMTNPIGSQGFVKFSISPYDTLPIGTRIENFADIYFDYNPPIRTPPVFNTIWDTTFVNLDPTVATICEPPTTAVAGADIQICMQDTVTLSANTPLKGVGTWKIISGNGVLADSMNPQTQFYSLVSGAHILEWKTQLCDSVTTDRMTITVNPNPPKPTISGIDQICAGDTAALFAPSGFATYRWSNGDTTESISATTAGTFSVSVTDANGCESPTSDDFTVVVNPNPMTPVISQVSNHSLQSSVSGDTYQWFLNGVSTSQSGATISPIQSGTYTVVVTTNGCVSDTSDGVVFLVTGIENGFEHSFAIYPNPNSGSFVLEMNPAPVSAVEIRLYDLQGKVVFRDNIKFEGTKANVETRELADGHAMSIPEGMYLLTVGDRVARKVVVR